MLDIVRRDSSFLRIGAGNQLSYVTSTDIQPTEVGNIMTLASRDTVAHLHLGVFAVTAEPIVAAIDIPWLPQGFDVPVPDTTITVPNIERTIQSFVSVTFQSGTMALTLDNNLPVPVEITTPVLLVDAQGSTICTFVFNPSTIAAYGSETATDNLDEKTLDNTFRLTNLQFHTPGSPTPVPIPFGDPLVATISTSDLEAHRAVFAVIPGQLLLDRDTTEVVLDDSTLVRELKLESGRLEISFANMIDLDVILKLRSLELLKPSGSGYTAYEDSVYLPPGGTSSLLLDLSGYLIQSQSGGLIHSLEMRSSLRVVNTSSNRVTVNDTDKVNFDIHYVEPLRIDTAAGVIKPTWVSIDKIVPVDFGEMPSRFSGHLNIPEAFLGLQTLSTIGFPADVYLQIGAQRNPGGDSVFLQVPAPQRRLQPGIDLIEFDAAETGQFLSQLSNRLPDSLRISGRILVNPPDVYNPTLAGVGSIGQRSSWEGAIDVDIPLTLRVTDGLFRDTLVIGDTTGDGQADFTFDHAELGQVNSGKMYMVVENALPLQVGVSFELLNAAEQIVLQLPQSGTPLGIAAAPVDGEGKVTVPAEQTMVIELSRSDVQQFNSANFLTYDLNLNTAPGSQSVSLRTTDFVHIRLWSTLSYRVER